jgi:hypothetical protein
VRLCGEIVRDQQAEIDQIAGVMKRSKWHRVTPVKTIMRAIANAE